MLTCNLNSIYYHKLDQRGEIWRKAYVQMDLSQLKGNGIKHTKSASARQLELICEYTDELVSGRIGSGWTYSEWL